MVAEGDETCDFVGSHFLNKGQTYDLDQLLSHRPQERVTLYEIDQEFEIKDRDQSYTYRHACKDTQYWTFVYLTPASTVFAAQEQLILYGMKELDGGVFLRCIVNKMSVWTVLRCEDSNFELSHFATHEQAITFAALLRNSKSNVSWKCVNYDHYASQDNPNSFIRIIDGTWSRNPSL